VAATPVQTPGTGVLEEANPPPTQKINWSECDGSLTDCSDSCVDPFTWMGRQIAGFCRRFAADFHSNRCWPEPLASMDRHTVPPVFELMIHHGWQQQNLLSDRHFVDQQAELTEVGKLKVRWIVTAAPSAHRKIYVQTGRTPGITSTRVKAVEKFLSWESLPGPPPEIIPVVLQPTWWSSSEVDRVHRQYYESAPKPTLDPSTSGGTDSQ